MSATKKVNIASIGQVFGDAILSPGRQYKQRPTDEIQVFNEEEVTRQQLLAVAKNRFQKYTKDGVTFNISGQEDVLNSIITDKPWNISEIEARPIPEAYFEVKFNELDQQNAEYPKRYGIGVGNLIFDSEQLLGLQRNSFAFFNTGSVWANGKEIQQLKPFSPGMTVGAGILLDSYNQQKLYFTVDGQLVGTINATVHKGMDCFPGVTFERLGIDPKVSFTINVAGLFLFSASSLPNFRGDMTNRFERLPKEIQLSCFEYAAYDTRQRVVLELRLVNKKFAAGMLENQIWRTQFMNRWPNQNRNIKFKSWYKMFINRHKIQATALNPTFIENCEMEFECPITANLLKDTNNPKEKFCNKCQKTVYEVHDNATLQDYAAMGRCVAFTRAEREIVRGKTRQETIEIPRPIPDMLAPPRSMMSFPK